MQTWYLYRLLVYPLNLDLLCFGMSITGAEVELSAGSPPRRVARIFDSEFLLLLSFEMMMNVMRQWLA